MASVNSVVWENSDYITKQDYIRRDVEALIDNIEHLLLYSEMYKLKFVEKFRDLWAKNYTVAEIKRFTQWTEREKQIIKEVNDVLLDLSIDLKRDLANALRSISSPPSEYIVTPDQRGSVPAGEYNEPAATSHDYLFLFYNLAAFISSQKNLVEIIVFLVRREQSIGPGWDMWNFLVDQRWADVQEKMLELVEIWSNRIGKPMPPPSGADSMGNRVFFGKSGKSYVETKRLNEDGEYTSILGQGGFGQVMAVRDSETGSEYACKLFVDKKNRNLLQFLIDSVGDYEKERFIADKMLQGGECNRYVLCLLDFGVHPTGFFTISEKADGDISKIWFGEPDLFRSEYLKMMFQTARGLEEIHNRGYSHNDLKPPNIFFFVRSEEEFDYKLGDLGGGCGGLGRGGKPIFKCSISGTPGFLSPEEVSAMVDQTPLTLQESQTADIFALAATWFAVLLEIGFAVAGQLFGQSFDKDSKQPIYNPISQRATVYAEDFLVNPFHMQEFDDEIQRLSEGSIPPGVQKEFADAVLRLFTDMLSPGIRPRASVIVSRIEQLLALLEP